MRTTAHDLFTYVNDGDTAQLSSFREQVLHILSHEQSVQENPNKPIPAFSLDESVILQVLQQNQLQELDGLELVKKSKSRLHRGTIYVTLERMRTNGLIESRHEQEDSSAPGISRRLYTATAFGKRVYAVWVKSRNEGSAASKGFIPKPT
ncbi:MAG: PadR family transcriptional regulator [Nitrospira sp.]|nr:PadR family transcriptional regulator [Nitrospira sp.]